MSSITGINASITTTQTQASQSGRQDPMKKVMNSMADLLGMTPSELKDAQENGKTLDDLASEKGISTDDLHAKLAEALEANKPTDAPEGMDFVQMAEEIASGTGPQGPGGPGGHGGPPPTRPDSDGSNSASSSLSDLLEAYGIDATDLTTLLSSSLASSTAYESTNSSDTSQSDFATQLQSLISKYGAKGNLYDTAL